MLNYCKNLSIKMKKIVYGMNITERCMKRTDSEIFTLFKCGINTHTKDYKSSSMIIQGNLE